MSPYYTNLFRTIILEYTNEEEKRYFNNINLNSEEDLTVAIPFFSKKIKEDRFENTKVDILK